MVIDDINLALKPYRLQFGPDPASSNRSTIGGAVANNATGSHSIIYGMTADHVLGMQVVFSDGSMSELTLIRSHQAANPVSPAT
jgi:FAD/FMN-containing dehydrogenase